MAAIPSFLREHPVQPRPASVCEVDVRDPDDAWVLRSALEAKAELLLTGDPDLLDLGSEIRGLRLVSPRGFWELSRRPPQS